MKKIFLFAVLVLSLAGSAQTKPTFPGGVGYQYIGGTSSVVEARGYFFANKGLAFSYFADTTAANLTLVDQIPYSLIVTANNRMWLRNLAKTAWLTIGPVQAGSGMTQNGNLIDLGGIMTSSALIGSTNGLGDKYFAIIDTLAAPTATLLGFGKKNSLAGSVLWINNVGAGVSAIQPVAQFTATGATPGQFIALRLGRNVNTANSDEGYISHYYNGSGNDSNSIVTSFGNNNRMLWVRSNGRVGIYNTSTTFFPQKTLHVRGPVMFDSLATTFDTTTYKIVGIDANGNFARGASWAGFLGGGASPAGNFGNLQVNRNGAFATPGSDSLDFESATGLRVKGDIATSTNLYAGGLVTPTAKVHIAAGSTSANSAPLKFTSGSLNTTAVAGQLEYNGNHYITNNAVRMGVGGSLKEFFTDVSNTGTTLENLYSYTIPANTFSTDGDKIEYEFLLTTQDATATVSAATYFAGNNLSTVQNITLASSFGFIMVKGSIIKTGGNFRSMQTWSRWNGDDFTNATQTDYNQQAATFSGGLTLTLSTTITGASPGAGDATARSGWIKFIPNANN